MGARSVWSTLTGYVIIKVKGPHLEAFLNQATDRGLFLWDVRRPRVDLLVAKTAATGLRALRPIARKQSVRITILKKQGWPFQLRRIWARKALVAGAILCLAAIYTSSTFVWFVAVDGIERVPVAEIKRVAGAMGLDVGAPKSAVQGDEIERQLLLDLPDLAWVSVEVKGTLARIRVAEKVVLDPDSHAPGDVVAARPGVVTEMSTFLGKALVQPGQTVVSGQVLISGVLSTDDPEYQKKVRLKQVPYLRADGLVRARVWYEGYGEAPLETYVEEPTGREEVSYMLRAGPWEWSFGGKRNKFAYDQTTRTPWRLSWHDVSLPLELIKVRKVEVDRKSRTLDPSDAKERAIQAAKAQAKGKLLGGGIILSESVETWEESREGIHLIRSKVLIEADEDIRGFRALRSGEVGRP